MAIITGAHMLLILSIILKVVTSAADPLKLAVILPFGYYGEEYSATINNSVQLAATEIDALNWFPGSSVQVDMVDDEDNRGVLIRKANEIINLGYNGVIAGSTSTVTKLISYTLTSAGSQGWANVAVFAGNSDYAQGLSDLVIKEATSYGVKVLTALTFELSDEESLDRKILTLKNSGARIIISLCSTEADMPPLYRRLSKHGMIGSDYVYIGGDAMSPAFSQNLTDEDIANFEGLFITIPREYSSSSKSFVENYKHTYNSEPTDGDAGHYDAVYAFAYAFKNIMTKYHLTVSQITSNAWKSLNLTVGQFLDFNFTGTMGPTSWSPNGEIEGGNYVLLNAIGQKWVQIATGNAAGLSFSQPPLFHSGSSEPPKDIGTLIDDTIGFTKPTSAVLIALVTIMAFVIVCSILLLMVFRTHAVLKPVSPVFMALSALGMLICLSTVYVDAVQEPTIIWAGAFPLLPIEYCDVVNERRYFQCETSSKVAGTAMTAILYTYNAILVCGCCYLALATRNIYSAFNEAKAIGVAIYNIFFCVIIVLIMKYLATTNVLVGFAIRSILVLFAVGVCYTAIIGRFLVALTRNVDPDTFGVSSPDSSSATSAVTTAKTRSAATSRGLFKSAVLPVRGSSTITSSQWRKHIIHLVAKPLGILILISEKDPGKGLAIPVASVNVAIKDDACFSVTWSKGSLTFQGRSKEEAADWVASIQLSQMSDDMSVNTEKGPAPARHMRHSISENSNV
ncbi:hypothetical protein HK104_000051 [Borealophlyctis nickersoniae]|nr:hypothetical protein HK104_000051 [Borealophlyctis nickersoniae]